MCQPCPLEHPGQPLKYAVNIRQRRAGAKLEEFPAHVMSLILGRRWDGEFMPFAPGLKPGEPLKAIDVLTGRALPIPPGLARAELDPEQAFHQSDCRMPSRMIMTQPPFASSLQARNGIFSLWRVEGRLFWLMPYHVATCMEEPPTWMAYDPSTVAVHLDTGLDWVVVHADAFYTRFLPGYIRPLTHLEPAPVAAEGDTVFVIIHGDLPFVRYKVLRRQSEGTVRYAPVDPTKITARGHSGALVTNKAGVPVGMHIADGCFVPLAEIKLCSRGPAGTVKWELPMMTWKDMRATVAPTSSILLRHATGADDGDPLAEARFDAATWMSQTRRAAPGTKGRPR